MKRSQYQPKETFPMGEKNILPSRPLARRLRSKMGNVLWSSIRIVKSALNINTEHRYSGFSITLPAHHLLPTFQEQHKLYDRFLPHLGKYLESKSTVIDVGANCGDTLAAMYDANPNLNFVCVEPDEICFDLLQRNLLRIKAIDANASITAINALAGKNVTNVSLEGSGGTQKAIIGGGGRSIASESLDHIISVGKATNIRLLKSDVDGFDYDVIDSAESVLGMYSPIIFFECHFDHLFQKAGYEKTIENLACRGYANWVIFDNFGEVMLRTDDTRHIGQLFDYVWRQNAGGSTRTVFYYDILANTGKDDELIGRVVDDYIASNCGAGAVGLS